MDSNNDQNSPSRAESAPASCSVTHCAAVVLMSPDDPTMIILRQECVCADDINAAVEAAKASAIEDNPGWIVQCASALYLSPNKRNPTE